eukprot:scaffold160591_cov26-Tisochrysis_lutea.AAC.1
METIWETESSEKARHSEWKGRSRPLGVRFERGERHTDGEWATSQGRHERLARQQGLAAR